MKYYSIVYLICCITFANAQETSQQNDLMVTVKDKVKKTDFPKDAQLSIGILNQDQTFLIGLEKAMRWKAVENENHIFEIGSISKVFTSLLLSTAVSDDVISLDDTIQHDWGIDWKVEEPITYKMLANHTSGLPRIPSNIMKYIASNPANPYVGYSQADLIEYLESHMYLEADPGKNYAYSNLGAALLAHLVCKQMGLTYEQALQTYVFKPLEMNHTTSERNKLKQEPVVGFDKKGEETSYWDFDVLAGAGALKSTVADLLTFMQFQLNDEREVVRLMRQKTFEGEPYDLGLGWHITKEGWLWHNGGTGGFTSSLVLNTENNQGVVILSNIAPDHQDAKIIDQLVFELLEELAE